MKYIDPFKNESGITSIGEDRTPYLKAMNIGLCQACRNLAPSFSKDFDVYSYLLGKAHPAPRNGETTEEWVDGVLSTLVCMGFRVMVSIDLDSPTYSYEFNQLTVKLVRYQGNDTQGLKVSVPLYLVDQLR